MKKILVTGGAGFIGSHLCDELIDLEYKVAVIDNLAAGKKEYINKKAKFYQADICNKKKIEKIFKKENFDYVFHLAAQIDVRISVADPELDNKINILGGLNILENCRKYKVKKIFFSSTGGAIYREGELPADEKSQADPVSPYGIHKLTFEKYLNYYYKVFDLKYIALRLANVYGPRQYKGGEAGVIAIFTDKAVNQETAVIFGDGRQTRDYVYVNDVVNAFKKSLASSYVGELNIATGRETNLLEIIKYIENSLGRKIKYKFGPAKAGEMRRSCLSYKKAEKIFGWKPKVNIKEGIRRTITWAQKK
jgi:UDP-glucose 4-epimerase